MYPATYRLCVSTKDMNLGGVSNTRICVWFFRFILFRFPSVLRATLIKATIVLLRCYSIKPVTHEHSFKQFFDLPLKTDVFFIFIAVNILTPLTGKKKSCGCFKNFGFKYDSLLAVTLFMCPWKAAFIYLLLPR